MFGCLPLASDLVEGWLVRSQVSTCSAGSSSFRHPEKWHHRGRQQGEMVKRVARTDACPGARCYLLHSLAAPRRRWGM